MTTAAALQAAPNTIPFSGVVTQVPVDEVYGDISAGVLFAGSYTFESTALDLIPGDTATASYASSGVPFSMTVTVAGRTFVAADSVSIGIFNSFVDQYTVLALGSGGDLTLEILLQDNTASALASDSLPLSMPSLSSFEIRDFHLHQVTDAGELQIDGLLSAPAAVPEPSTAVLSCAGAVGLWALSRRRRRANSTRT